MEKIFEIKQHILNFYTKYSRIIDLVLKFVLALLTFGFVNNNVGFLPAISNPVVTVGLSIVCTFLPLVMTAIFASGILLLQFFSLAPGAAVVSALLLLVMFSLYFRFSLGTSIILVVTPLAFTMKIPILVPVVFGLIGGPLYAIPIAFGTIVYFLIAYVKAYAAVIETVAEAGVIAQLTTFTQQLFSNKEMWLIIISFTVCLLVVYSIKRLSVDRAWEIAVAAGILINIILISFGHVMIGISISYVQLIVGSIITAVVALILELFVFSVDYTRTEYLQFEDDEYYYYVKAVPKISVAAPEKTVKKINARQEAEEDKQKETETEEEAGEVVEAAQEKQEEAAVAVETEEEKRIRMEQDESEIQKIIEEELKN